jgi:hypothetical protein
MFSAYLLYTQKEESQKDFSQREFMQQFYPQRQQQMQKLPDPTACPRCAQNQPPAQRPTEILPIVTNVNVQNEGDPYSDSIKKQDEYMMYDPLTYPQLRLPREVLDRYNQYYEKKGVYPPFNQATQPQLFDNPVLNGILIKINDNDEPFNENVPSSVPLFRVKSVKNANRYFYYILDQRYLSSVEMKIPLDHVKVNGHKYNNADFYGIPELFDGDVICDIPIYPEAKFKVTLYKTYHFP